MAQEERGTYSATKQRVLGATKQLMTNVPDLIDDKIKRIERDIDDLRVRDKEADDFQGARRSIRRAHP